MSPALSPHRRFALAAGLCLALAACSSGAGIGGDSGPDPRRPARDLEPLDRAAFGDILTGLRRDNGQGALAMDGRLNRAAQDYATVLERTPGRLGHRADGRTVGERARAAGYDYRWVAENLAWGHRSNAQVAEAWMRSPSHRANMLDPRAEDFGLGREGRSWVLMLGAEK